MVFKIRMGQPEMEELWLDLSTRKLRGGLDKDEEKLFKKLVKALGFLSSNPKHNSLASHEITELSRKYGIRIFKSYLKNNTPGSGRIFWASRACQTTASFMVKRQTGFQRLLRSGSVYRG